MNPSIAFCPRCSPKGSVGQGKERGPAVVSCLTLLRIGYGEGIQGGRGKALGPSGLWVRLRSQSLPLEQAGERDWALRRWPVVEEGGGGIRWSTSC